MFSGTQNLSSEFVFPGIIFFCLCSVFCRHEEGPSSFLDGLLNAICLRIKVDAIGDSGEHVTVGDTIVLGHAHADAVASGVDHGLKMTGGGMPNLKKPKQGQPPHGTF